MNRENGKWWPPESDRFMRDHEETAAKRAAAFKEKGCAYWYEGNLQNCSFPLCKACYPFWRKT